MPPVTVDTIHVSNALAAAQYPAKDILRALRGAPGLPPTAREEVLKLVNRGQDDVDRLRAQGTIGLTVQLNSVLIKDAHDRFLAGKTGEIYVVSWILTGNGTTAEFRSKQFTGIRSMENLPLGSGGMLLGYLTDPRWFVDMHAIVMESDSDIRGIGEAITKAKSESGWNELLKNLDTVGVLDPTKITQASNILSLTADLVAFFLRQNGDDHVGTIHDFFLESQAFGAGTYPEDGEKDFQDVAASYTIGLSLVQ